MSSPSTTDPVLSAETDHLFRARESLGHMRERADHIADYGVDALASEALGAVRAQRLKALADDPKVPPFFGRIDRLPDEEHPGGETFHIGRRHIRDNDGDPLVIDWRAEMARTFYRATTADPLGIRRRRRFGFAGTLLTSYEDEALSTPDAAPTGESRILLEEIERPRVGPMRDIVATIQPDQDDIVRAPLDDSICVQGAPGTGKTAVGLHRAAYLLYTYPDRLRRSGVLVVGPNRAFLSYIAQVLPALGEAGVRQFTVQQLLAPVAVRGLEAAETATLKGEARMAEVLRRATYSGVNRPRESLLVPVGTRRYRIPPEPLRRYVDDLRRADIRYTAARDRLHLLVAEDLRRQREASGGAPSDAETGRIARSAAVRAFADQVWPAVDAAGLLFRLYTDAEFLARCGDGLLEPEEQRMLLWSKVPRSVRAARWTGADAVLIDEIVGMLDRTATYGHVVLDEAQDLSPMQCRGVARRCPTGSITVLGDLAQGTTPWAATNWPSTLAHLGKENARIEPLTRGYRVPADVIELANRLLPYLAIGLTPSTSVRSGSGGLRLRAADQGGAAAAVVEEVRALLAAEGSIGVIVADAAIGPVQQALQAAGMAYDLLGDAIDDAADPAEEGADEVAEAVDPPRISIVPATLVKGLEYDFVVVVEPAEIVAAEPRGLRRLYVALTRAVSRLVVVHGQPLPVQLTA
jgi:DNA helicase IV